MTKTSQLGQMLIPSRSTRSLRCDAQHRHYESTAHVCRVLRHDMQQGTVMRSLRSLSCAIVGLGWITSLAGLGRPAGGRLGSGSHSDRDRVGHDRGLCTARDQPIQPGPHRGNHRWSQCSDGCVPALADAAKIGRGRGTTRSSRPQHTRCGAADRRAILGSVRFAGRVLQVSRQ